MEPQQLHLLFNRYLENRCSREEVELLALYFHTDNEKILGDLIEKELDQNIPFGDQKTLQASVDKVHAQLKLKINPASPLVKRLWPRIAAAASIILALSFGGYLLLHQPAPQQMAQNQLHDLKPGTNSATLTLANGQQIILAKSMRGKLAQQGNMNIQMTTGGTIAYQAGQEPGTESSVYNTLSTKKGEQFPLLLADGTQVTLDAASSITYPVAFNGKERKVTITGQAYFKVVHKEQQPFFVSVKDQTIRDIGTEFNINAYDDEPATRTTLVEGGISIHKGDAIAILKPGQQALVQPNSNTIAVKNVNIESVVAWKNGRFLFNDENLASIMRQVARWYDVEVIYENEGLKAKTFGGVTARFGNVSELLHTLEMTNQVKFTITGRKITVQNKQQHINP